MSDALTIASSDRLLILAPHPDDESIATGGLIQIARDAGAAVRVVVLTDGDNNPWPQRWIEKRWRIDARARARWGARRRAEACAAMRVLGLDADAAVFLGLPDLGLTDLLMRNDADAMGMLRAAIDEFRPSVLIMPAVSDRHPDHSAAHILARSALAQSSAMPRLLTFGVHGGSSGETVVDLTEAQRSLKANAILAHASQMRLSRRRFLRYAGNVEAFDEAGPVAKENSKHPLRAWVRGDGKVEVRVDPLRWGGTLYGHALFVVLDAGDRVRCPLGNAMPINQRHRELRAIVECPGNLPGYVKLARPQPGWRVFDRWGWQVIGQAERDARNG
jgi:LmbE family N-acetylglucosaminyl deacetylase